MFLMGAQSNLCIFEYYKTNKSFHPNKLYLGLCWMNFQNKTDALERNYY